MNSKIQNESAIENFNSRDILESEFARNQRQILFANMSKRYEVLYKIWDLMKTVG